MKVRAALQFGVDAAPRLGPEAAGAVRAPDVVPSAAASNCLAADAGDGFGRIDDRDAGMTAEGEKIGIAGDDQVGLRCGCEGQHRVV